MITKLAFKRICLEPGGTFAMATGAGARMRVVDGVVWATTTGSVDDVWLHRGQEYRVGRRGLTVIEAAGRSIVEWLPPRSGLSRLMSSLARPLRQIGTALARLADAVRHVLNTVRAAMAWRGSQSRATSKANR